MRSPRFDAVLDRVLDTPEKVLVLGLKGKRRAQALAARTGRWLQRRLAAPSRPPSQPVMLPLPAAAAQPRTGDRFVLYRIVGNDLYPRHDAGQSLANLRFILENEPPLEGCEKRWLLNRIRQPEKLQELIGLLEAHGYGYDLIPFDAAEFQAVPWDWSVLPSPDFLAAPAYRRLLSHQRQSWEIALYRLKNNYLMHNNGARNRALELGRQRADWVLPWDGNCFVTAAGWRELRQAVLDQSSCDYFHVPMQRIADNAHLLDPAFEAAPRDEPQLLFAATAAEQFNPAFPYGRRPKVELFWRLGLPGLWDAWLDEPWDQPRRPCLQPAPACPRAGWVARLHSGVRDAGAAAAVLSQQRRYGARNLAIKASINQALVAERPLQSSAFAAHWGRPGERLPQQALQAESLLNAWQRWRQQGGPAPAAQQEQLISAFVHLAWQTLHTPATATPAAELLESLAASWFAAGHAGLQPRLRLLRRPLARGRLPGTEPSLAAVEQLAILSDLLAWAEAESALVPALLAWPWLERFRSWRDALADQLQQLLHPAWLGPRAEDQQRLQLVLALLQRHRQRPAEPVDALLRLLSALQGDTPVPPARRVLILALAQQHGLLDPGLGAALGAAAEPGLPIPGLVAFPGLGPR